MLLAFYAPQKRRRILTAWAHFWRATPEALGLIFDYLNPIEVKNFQQVCKYFAEIARAKSAHRQHVKNLTSEYLLLKASSLQTYITESMSEPQTRNSHLPTECLARQWVQRVTGFSSEYGGWPASNVTNASNTYPAYGDIVSICRTKFLMYCRELLGHLLKLKAN
jgi:phage terminase small subunit